MPEVEYSTALFSRNLYLINWEGLEGFAENVIHGTNLGCQRILQTLQTYAYYLATRLSHEGLIFVIKVTLASIIDRRIYQFNFQELRVCLLFEFCYSNVGNVFTFNIFPQSYMHFRSHISSSLLKDFTKRPKYRELLVSYFTVKILQLCMCHVHYFTRQVEVVRTWMKN